MNDAALRRDLAVAALCFGISGLLLGRLMPPLGIGLSLAGAALGLVSLKHWMEAARRTREP